MIIINCAHCGKPIRTRPSLVGNKEDFSETKTAWPKTTPMDAGAVENDFSGQKAKLIRKGQEVSL